MNFTDKFPLPRDPNDFVSDIIAAAPPDNITLKEMIGVGRIQYSSHPEMTAAVANTKPYTLIFGKPFCEEKMQTMNDCVFLLWHELTHLVLDHFAIDIVNLFKEKGLGRDKENRATVFAEQATHIVVDCQVNATCYHTLRKEKYFKLIKRMYPVDQMPYCFLRPDGTPPDQFKEAHAKLWSENGITNEELIDVLLPWFQEHENELKDIIKNLLGNHQDMFERAAGNGGSGELSELTESVIKDILDSGTDKEKENLKENLDKLKKQGEGEEGSQDDQKEQGGKQAGRGEKVVKRYVETVLSKIEHARELAKKLKKSYVISPCSRIHAALEGFNPKRSARTVIPNFHDRRTSALYSLGHMPVFHKVKSRDSKVIVPCYVDVSGSQNHMIPIVIPVVSRLKRLIGEELYCFSDYVSPTRLIDFSKGEYETSGGTNFNPVIEHMLRNKFTRAVILTDGHAYLNPDLAAKVRQRGIKIKVGWTESSVSLEPLSSIASETFYVFGDGNGRGR